MKRRFVGKSVEECLEQAENTLSCSRDDFKYNVVKRGGLFKKHYEIEVTVRDTEKDIIDSLVEKDENTNNGREKSNSNNQIKNNESQEVIAKDGHIIFKEGVEGEFELVFDKGVTLIVNDLEATQGCKVTNHDRIIYLPNNEESKRELDIKSDAMKAYITINYVPEIIEEYYCIKKQNVINVKCRKIKGEMPPHYRAGEIEAILRERKIIFGLKDEEIKRASELDEVDNMLVAEGIKPIDDKEDRLEIKFKNTTRRVDEDSDQRVDYKNMYSYANVAAGEVLGEVIVGEVGKNGVNIFGQDVERKRKKPLFIKADRGCRVEGNKVISTIEGAPSVKNGLFFVNEIYQFTSDVNLKSGNIDFIGDVKIAKSVKEGMTVKAGNTVFIEGNVESASVISQGEARILGSIINSTIEAGAKNMVLQQYLDGLVQLKSDVEQIITLSEELKEKPAFMYKSDGEIVKLLIEKKFKTLPRRALLLMSNPNNDNDKIKAYINSKLIGSGPFNIKFVNELYNLIDLVNEEMAPLKEDVFLPVDVYVNYVQDSKINATGSIIIQGKGQYVSDMTALKDIVFENEKAVSRGGKLTASGNIRCATVGSSAGVSTTLKVKKGGIITADIVYRNTVFIVGDRHYTFEEDSKDVKAYFSDGDIVVDKFVL